MILLGNDAFRTSLRIHAQEFEWNWLICFGLRFGGRKSEAQAERRLERSRSATTAAVPQTEATPLHAAKKMPLTTNARGVRDRAD
jgi:hypothetical protein